MGWQVLEFRPTFLESLCAITVIIGVIVAKVPVFLIGSLRLDFLVLPRLEEKRVKRRCGPV